MDKNSTLFIYIIIRLNRWSLVIAMGSIQFFHFFHFWYVEKWKTLAKRIEEYGYKLESKKRGKKRTTQYMITKVEK